MNKLSFFAVCVLALIFSVPCSAQDSYPKGIRRADNSEQQRYSENYPRKSSRYSGNTVRSKLNKNFKPGPSDSHPYKGMRDSDLRNSASSNNAAVKRQLHSGSPKFNSAFSSGKSNSQKALELYLERERAKGPGSTSLSKNPKYRVSETHPERGMHDHDFYNKNTENNREVKRRLRSGKLPGRGVFDEDHEKIRRRLSVQGDTE